MGVRGRDRGVPWERPSTFSVVPFCAWEGITVGEVAYGSLAPVYEWLVPDAKASPAGSAQAFGMVTAGLGPGAQILDCACGIGLLAVGLAAGWVPGHRVRCQPGDGRADPGAGSRSRSRGAGAGMPLGPATRARLAGPVRRCAVRRELARARGRTQWPARRDRRYGIRAGDGWGAGADLPQLGADPLGRQPAGRLGPARGARRPQGSGGVLLAGAAFMGDRTPPADLGGSTPRR